MSLTSALANSTAGLAVQSQTLAAVSAVTGAANKPATSEFGSLLAGLTGADGSGPSAIPTSVFQPIQGASCAAAATGNQVAAAGFAYTRHAQQAYSAASAVATSVNSMFHTLQQVLS
jgi:hypothetical protein